MNDQRPEQTTPAGDTSRAPGAFNPEEWNALRNIRESYHAVHDFFSPAELARLRFVRWLYETDGQVARLSS